MTTRQFVLIDGGVATPAAVDMVGERPHLSTADLTAATGWTVKPEGFCYEDICIPAGAAITPSGAVDLAAFARLTGKPLIVDATEQVISIGVASADRGASMQSLEAPDFTLPDLKGELHSLSQYRGKKILLASYASW